MTTIPTMQKGQTAFLITGDASRNKVQTMPGGGFSTVRIDLPAGWDALMAAKGYPALQDMYLTPTNGETNHTSVNTPKSATPRKTPVRTYYYDTQGRRTNGIQRGINIRRYYYIDGSSQAEKIIN